MYFIFYFLFLILNITFADTILPLPIEDLRKIEMKYDDTLVQPFPLDTIYLKIYGGNIFWGDINLTRVIDKTIFLNLNGKCEKNRDFSNYLLADGKVNLGWSAREFWHEFAFATNWKKRGQRYYQRMEVYYNPIWFTSKGTFTLKNTVRGASYIDTEQNNFFSGCADLAFNSPSRLGIINSNANIFYQANNRAGDKFLTTTSAGLSDLITIGDNLFIKPGVHYNIEKEILTISSNLGFIISGVTTFIDLQQNVLKTFSFDSLYTDVFPFLVTEDLDYPICDWQCGTTIQWKDFRFSGIYQQFSSYLNWVRAQKDSWIIPELLDSTYSQISLNLAGKWRFLKNYFSVNYTPDTRNLVPRYIISDSILINAGKFEIISDIVVAGKRTWYNRTLPNDILLSSQIGYKWRFVKLFARIENILNNKYEILPNRFDTGSNYFIGLETIK